MVEGKTKSGFKFKVNENIFRDWDFLTLSDTINNGNATMENVNKLISMVLGEKGFDSLKDHIRKKLGVADYDAVKNEFKEICENTKIKN